MTFQQATPAIILSTFLFIAFAANFAVGQTTAFTYQGKLIDSSQPANGTYEMEFRLFNDPQVGAGGQQGATITLPSVQAVGGVFTTSLDFGPEVFETGNNLYLEISLRPAGSQVAFTTLTPRQAMTSAPYAIRSKTAGIADNSANLGSIPASSYVLTGDNRLSDARTPTPGSDDYIQNAMNAQVSANFNIGGTGTANIINAKTQFNINGSRIISTGNSGTNNLFVGINAGEQNGGGNNNSAFGFNSGRFLTTGVSNSFFGVGSGFSVGVGNFNSFFGHLSGSNVLAGSNNTFFGYATGFNSVGNANTFFGSSSGMSNLGGSNNTLLGANTDVTIGNLSFATAIGSGAVVGNSNSIVIGRSSGDDAVFVPGDLTVNGTLNAKLPAGSGNYIQNGISVQASSNFNISGNGTVGGTLGANLVNSSTQYNIAGQRILSNGGTSNMFVGTTTGAALTTGADNAFFGANSGDSTTTGSLNSFFGSSAGQANVSGGNNSFVGYHAGFNNTSNNNSFFGSNAGVNNSTGFNNSVFGKDAGFNLNGTNSNSFFGYLTGFNNSSGNQNSFFGANAGSNNNGGSANSFIGYEAGKSNTSGFDNLFIGAGAGFSNTTGLKNTMIGYNAEPFTSNLSNATAIGANAVVGQNNSLVLGSIAGMNGASADTKVGIGTSTPSERLSIETPSNNYGWVHTQGSITMGSYVGGTGANPYGGWIGTKTNHPLSFFVNGANNGAPAMTIETSGFLTLNNVDTGGSGPSLCLNASSHISFCSSSLRYKTNVASFKPGLSMVKQLMPITFDWKDGGGHDVGFGAEEVAKISDLLVIHNKQGQVEGVKYDRISAVLVNAVNEQQVQIDRQWKLILSLEDRLLELERSVRAARNRTRRTNNVRK